MYCRNCGAKNPDESKFCSGCGASLGNPETKQEKVEVQPPVVTLAQEQPTVTQPIYALPERKKTGHGAVIAVVALLILAGVGYYLADNYGHQAYVEYKVHSTHITETVDVTVFFDDEAVATWHGLGPGQYFHNNNYRSAFFSLFENSHMLTVKAISSGGGLGNQEDSETIVIVPGGKYTVDLYV